MANLLLSFCEAISHPIYPLEGIVRGDDDYEPWERAVNVDAAPRWVLPWLAGLVGVEWRSNPTEQLRDLIIERPRYKRGTNAAIISAAKSTLIGTKTVNIIPRVGGSFALLTVNTIPAETPNPALTEAAIRSQLPVWVRPQLILLTLLLR
jgi:hypothetical protein